jgi:outer membrane protein X
MKKFLLLALVGLMSVSSYAQKGETFVGLNLGYGTEIKSFDIRAKVGYGITDQIRVSPSFNYFLEKDGLS